MLNLGARGNRLLSTQARYRHGRGTGARDHALKKRQTLQTSRRKRADKRIARGGRIDHFARQRRHAQQLTVVAKRDRTGTSQRDNCSAGSFAEQRLERGGAARLWCTSPWSSS